MDRYERMQIRAAAEWRDKLRQGDGKAIVDPLTGEIVPDPEVHHIARAKYGELAIPLSKATHREMTRRQMEEHPKGDHDPDNPIVRMAMFLRGAADLMDSIVEEMRRIAEVLLRLAAGIHSL